MNHIPKYPIFINNDQKITYSTKISSLLTMNITISSSTNKLKILCPLLFSSTEAPPEQRRPAPCALCPAPCALRPEPSALRLSPVEITKAQKQIYLYTNFSAPCALRSEPSALRLSSAEVPMPGQRRTAPRLRLRLHRAKPEL